MEAFRQLAIELNIAGAIGHVMQAGEYDFLSVDPDGRLWMDDGVNEPTEISWELLQESGLEIVLWGNTTYGHATTAV